MPELFDRIGDWTAVKLDIITEYAAAFSRIVGGQPYLKPVYIDGFAGPGKHILKRSGESIRGTPLRILEIPFTEYHFIELDAKKHAELMKSVGGTPAVSLYRGDCNRVLLDQVFPRMGFKTYRRGLCFLDPYGTHLKWEVVAEAGRLGTIDLLVNFPIMDMNMNALKKNPDKVSAAERARLTEFFGNEDAWMTAAYSTAPGLFEKFRVKEDNEAVVDAYRKRLRGVFSHVSKALPMRNSKGATVYYLVGASQKAVATKIINEVFRKHEGI